MQALCFADLMQSLAPESPDPSEPEAARPETLRRPSVARRTARTVGALILREMGSTYGRSPGGYLWVILEPIGAILVLSLAFSLMLRSPGLGTSFFLFYATGYLPFDLFQNISARTAGALNYSRPLLAYPGVTWIDAVMARFILNTLTTGAVFCIITTGTLLLVDTRTVLDIGPILTGMALAACLGLGVGLMNCLLRGLYPVWGNIWNIANRPLFLASGVFFIYEDMPPFAQDILWWNPLLHVAGWVRTGFYPTYHASYVSLAYGYGIALVLIAFGLLLLRAHYKTVLER